MNIKDQTQKRAKRNAARNKMIQLGMASKGDGKDIDHIKPLRKGGASVTTKFMRMTWSLTVIFEMTALPTAPSSH